MKDKELFGIIGSYIDELYSQSPDCFSAILAPKLHSVSLEPLKIVMAYSPREFMTNTALIVHGGITASYADLTMGTLARYVTGGQFSPTVDMQVSYHKPVPAGGAVYVTAECVSRGRTVSSFRCDIRAEGEDAILVSATGLYYTKFRQPE
ncbi:MAG: PaaI family thioesterase [Oscillospiraceae bacterium]|nr:PaaI family thioesterase [Oscillospiraceae bacterium]